jgi:hypothetical protein
VESSSPAVKHSLFEDLLDPEVRKSMKLGELKMKYPSDFSRGSDHGHTGMLQMYHVNHEKI